MGHANLDDVPARQSPYGADVKRRLAELPLHAGSAPPWLFQRMRKLAGALTMAVVDEYGPGKMLRRLADP